jgi:hypothetical protein
VRAVSGLTAQQEWFARQVTATATPPGSDAARVLLPGPRSTSAERLQIYRDAYRGRLVECLADDYPAVQYLLGNAAFEEAANEYIDAHPSRSPSLNAFGRSMSDFLTRQAESFGPSVGELARLEWGIVEAIHATPGTPIALDRLEQMTPEQWTTARLVPAPSVRVLSFAHAVNAYYVAFREGAKPTRVAASPSATLIHRRGWVVWRTDLTPPMRRLLAALVAGAPLGEALATAITDEDEGTEANVTRWFRDWVSEGVFTAVDLPEP